jgi:hypothetical protein
MVPCLHVTTFVTHEAVVKFLHEDEESSCRYFCFADHSGGQNVDPPTSAEIVAVNSGETSLPIFSDAELDGWKSSSTPPGAGAEAASSILRRTQVGQPRLSGLSTGSARHLDHSLPRSCSMLAAELVVQYPRSGGGLFDERVPVAEGVISSITYGLVWLKVL